MPVLHACATEAEGETYFCRRLTDTSASIKPLMTCELHTGKVRSLTEQENYRPRTNEANLTMGQRHLYKKSHSGRIDNQDPHSCKRKHDDMRMLDLGKFLTHGKPFRGTMRTLNKAKDVKTTSAVRW